MDRYDDHVVLTETDGNDLVPFDAQARPRSVALLLRDTTA